MLRICLFGQGYFEYDGEPLKFSALPRTLPLWAYLLLHRDQPIKRSALAFTLWLDQSETAARANLRRHLHELRRVLPPPPADQPWLLNEGDTTRWNPDAPFWLDVAEFERLSGADATLAAAVPLYRGDLLETIYDDWLLYERERLRNLLFADLNRLIGQHRAAADYPAALRYAQILLSRDPLHEGSLRQLLTLRYEVGDRSGAIQQYEQFTRQLRQELGVEPMPETVALYEAIARNARLPGATVELSDTAALAGRVSRNSLPFVGRGSEMAALGEHWAAALQGRGGLVMVSGEAGIGKSRLVAEFARQVEGAGARVLIGSSVFGEPIPYQAFFEALRSALPLLVALDIDPIWLAVAAILLPELRTRRAATSAALPRLVPLDPERERTRLFEGIARCLQGLAEPRPVLLILEDLHWAGADTVDLLEFLARASGDQPILILATYRDEETTRSHPLRELRRRLQRQNGAAHIALGRLSASAVASLVAQAPLGAGDSPQLADTLYAESEGNPFFLGELIRDLIESGEAAEEHRPVPGGVRAIIAGRVARLSPDAATLAEIAAVVGQAFDIEVVREVSGWDEHQVLDGMNELLDRQLVREAGGRSMDDYIFSHHFIQAAIYDEIAPARAARRHRRVAQVLEEVYPQRRNELAARLAGHFDLGNDPIPAAAYYKLAAQRALEVYADSEALRYVARALELAGDPRTRFELLAMLEAISGRRGERQMQATDLEQMRLLAEQLGDTAAICEVLRREILLQRALGERQAEAALIARFKEQAQVAGPHWRAEALQAEAAYLLTISRYDEAREGCEMALTVRRELDDSGGQADCYALLAEAAVLQGRFDEAEGFLQLATTVGGPGANRALPLNTLRAVVRAALVRQDFASVTTLGGRLLQLSRRTGDREGEAEAHARLAAAAARRFQLAEAQSHYEQAEALFKLLGDRKGQAAVLVNAGMMAGNLGQFTAAIRAAEQAEELFRALDDLRGQTISALNISWNSWQLADYPTAIAAGERALRLAGEMKSPLFEAFALANLGAAERDSGALAEGIAHMKAALVIRRQISQPLEIVSDLCDLAIGYLRAHELPAARATMDEMLPLAESNLADMTYPQYIFWAAAQIHRASGDDEAAAAMLDRAYASVQDKAANFTDATSRAAYLQISFNREVLAAHDSGIWP